MTACNKAYCYGRTRTNHGDFGAEMTLSKKIVTTLLSKTGELIGTPINSSDSFSKFSIVILFITPIT
jgi:hypothetical protein